MPALPQSNIHLDILMGRDETLQPVDFFGGVTLFMTPLCVYWTDRCIRSGGRSLDGHPQRYGEEAPHLIVEYLSNQIGILCNSLLPSFVCQSMAVTSFII